MLLPRPLGNTEGGALTCNAFSYLSTDPLLVTAPSGNTAASSGESGQAQHGQPAFYVNSTHTCFDLKSIDFACGVNAQQGAITSTQTCTIQIAGKVIIGNVPFELLL